MNRKIKLLLSVALLLLAGALLIKVNNHRPVRYPGATPENCVGVIVPADENEGVYSDIKGFVNGDGVVLFMPCRADVSRVVYYAIDEQGSYLERFETNFQEGPGLVLDLPVVCMQSNLPTVEIVTDDEYGTFAAVEEDVLHETSAYGGMVVSVRDELADVTGWDKVYEAQNGNYKNPGAIEIKGRGNLTWEEDKKPFLVTTEIGGSILGMAAGEKWVFLANVIDHACIRNEIALSLAKDCNVAYTADVQPVDLFINGEYRGNYSLCSKVEISDTRVNIDEQKDYFYRWGLASGTYREIESTSLWNEDNVVELINAKDESTASNYMSNEKAFDIFQRVIAEIEDTESSDFLNDIDIESWARYYWVQEMMKNTDACFRSVYSYWDAEAEKMYLIAPWDFDRTIGTVEQYNKDLDWLMPTNWCTRYDEWFVPLFEHPEFVAEVERVYFEGGVKEALEKCASEAPSRLDRVTMSAMMNFTRWDYLDRPLEDYYNKIALYMGDSSFNSEAGWVKEWLRQRAQWIDEEMNDARTQ